MFSLFPRDDPELLEDLIRVSGTGGSILRVSRFGEHLIGVEFRKKSEEGGGL